MKKIIVINNAKPKPYQEVNMPAHKLRMGSYLKKEEEVVLESAPVEAPVSEEPVAQEAGYDPGMQSPEVVDVNAGEVFEAPAEEAPAAEESAPAEEVKAEETVFGGTELPDKPKKNKSKIKAALGFK